jgi:hypothetical protein
MSNFCHLFFSVKLTIESLDDSRSGGERSWTQRHRLEKGHVFPDATMEEREASFLPLRPS